MLELGEEQKKPQKNPTLFALTEKPSPFKLPLCFLFPLAPCTEFPLIEMLSTAASISSAAPKAYPDSTLLHYYTIG